MKKIVVLLVFLLISFQCLSIASEGNSDIEIEMDTLPLIRMPVIIHFVKATYPLNERRLGIEGIVLLRLLVEENGLVEKCEIIKSLHPRLDSNAVKAAQSFRFKPALTEDGPIAVLLDYEYIFSLNEIINSIKPSINLKGQLVEKGKRSPVPYAMVSVHCINPFLDSTLSIPFNRYLEHISGFEGQHREEDMVITTSDSLGFFSFSSLPACSIQISAFCNGYKPFTSKEIIHPDSLLNVKYVITNNSYDNYEITVYGQSTKHEVIQHHISKSEVSGIAGVSGDAVKIVQTLPGVARPDFIDGEMCFRGADAFDSEILLEGLQFYIPFHMGSYKSSYNSEAIESIDYLPGGFSVRYGNAVGGILDLKGRSGRSDRWGGFLDCNIVDGTIFVEGPLSSKVTLLGSLRTSYLHHFLNLVYKHSNLNLPYYLSPQYRDALLRIDFRPNKKHHLFLTTGFFDSGVEFIYPSARGGHDSVNKNSDRLEGMWKWYTIIAGWDWNINRYWKNTFRLNKVGEKDNFQGFGLYSWKDSEGGFFLRNETSWKPNRNIATYFGIFAEHYKWKGKMILPDVYTNILSQDELETKQPLSVAFYALADIKIRDKLLIIPGLRYDYWNIEDHSGTSLPEFWNYKNIDNTNRVSGDPSFRITMRYLINNCHTLKAAIGNYSQYPQPYIARTDKFGNPLLTTTKARHAVLGYEWKINDLLFADIQIYENRQWDKTRKTTLKEQQQGSPFFLDDDKAKIYGLELLLRFNRSKHFFGWLSYTLSKSQRYDFTQNTYIPFDKDQTHNIIAVGTWYLPRNFDCGLRIQYTTGNPITPVIGSKYDEVFLTYLPIEGKRNSERLPPSFQVHVRFGKRMVMKNWILSTYLDIFNASYPLYKSPQGYLYNYDPYDYLINQPDKVQVSELIIPSLGIKAEF